MLPGVSIREARLSSPLMPIEGKAGPENVDLQPMLQWSSVGLAGWWWCWVGGWGLCLALRASPDGVGWVCAAARYIYTSTCIYLNNQCGFVVVELLAKRKLLAEKP